MRWNRFIFRCWIVAVGGCMNPVATWAQADTTTTQQSDAIMQGKYDKRVLRIRKRWAALIPSQFIVQNAGNMGELSEGIGWNYSQAQEQSRQTDNYTERELPAVEYRLETWVESTTVAGQYLS